MPKRAAVARSMTRLTAQALLLLIAGDVGDLRQLAQALNQPRHPGVEFGRIGVLEDEMIGRFADRRIDRQILHRLHVEGNADDAGDLALQAANDLAGGEVALVVRLERDQQAAGIERLVGAVDADERADVDDVRILQHRLGKLVLQVRHGVIGNALRGLGDGLDQAGVLHREEAFRDQHVEQNGQRQGQHGDRQRRRLPVQHPVQGPARTGR